MTNFGNAFFTSQSNIICNVLESIAFCIEIIGMAQPEQETVEKIINVNTVKK